MPTLNNQNDIEELAQEMLTHLSCGLCDGCEEVAKKVITRAKEAGRQEILNYLSQHGQGGGNWRRLIEQLKNN